MEGVEPYLREEEVGRRMADIQEVRESFEESGDDTNRKLSAPSSAPSLPHLGESGSLERKGA